MENSLFAPEPFKVVAIRFGPVDQIQSNQYSAGPFLLPAIVGCVVIGPPQQLMTKK
jgi:hypothetical protein